MNKFTMIMVTGACAALLVWGTAFSQTLGPRTKDQNDDLTSATNCQPPWDRSPYLGDEWNIERGMIEPGRGSDMGTDMLRVHPWDNPPFRRFATPLASKDAQAMAENYLDSTNNPNLKLGNEKDESTDYEFDVLTRDNSLVDRLLVDKNTGEIRSAY